MKNSSKTQHARLRKYSELEDYALDQAIKTLIRLAQNKRSKHLKIVRGDK